MAGEKVSVEKQDVRVNYPNFTGNFIIAGTPEHKKLSTAYVINFRLNWSNYKGKGTYGDPNYIAAECFAENEEQLQEVLKSITPKGRIHVTKGTPRVDSWEKDGRKNYKFVVNVKEWYPYHLDKDLNERTSSSNSNNTTSSSNESESSVAKSDDIL